MATRDILVSVLGPKASALDDSVMDYVVDALTDCSLYHAPEDIVEAIGPFLEDTGAFDEELVAIMCEQIFVKMENKGLIKGKKKQHEKLDKAVSVAELTAGHETKGHILLNLPQNAATPLNAAEETRKKALEESLQKAEAKIAQKTADRERRDEEMAAAKQAARKEMRNTIQSHVNISGRAGAPESGVRDIAIQAFSLAYGGEELLVDTTLQLAWGRRYGLIGRNGVGKTSLLRHIANRDLPIPTQMTILYVAQEADATDLTALETVVRADKERLALIEEEKRLTSESGSTSTASGTSARLKEIYDRLVEIDADSMETRASEILSGLQFTPQMQQMKTREFSGGWRMRIALAEALAKPPDLLILDEPTNHLDLPACFWLETYLAQWESTLLVVSHAREFLNAVCTDIIHLHNKKLTPYPGNFDAFVHVREERELAQTRAFDRQQRERAHMEKFVIKFRYKASGAKMAQSRIKKLDKMVLIDEVVSESHLKIHFPEPEKVAGALLQFQDVSFGYGDQEVLFKNLTFNLDMESRISLVGPNGVGKSTILKLFSGDIQPKSGFVVRMNKLRLARFEQHFVDALDLDQSALEFFKASYPDIELQDHRSYLGRFGVTGDMATQPISSLSGGQKSRVVLAKISMNTPHMLLMDEPTNHLDMDAIDALAMALNDFPGGVVLVTHDQRLVSLVCNELWMCENQTVIPFDGDFDDYKAYLMSKSTLPQGPAAR